jgi:hypothetical protein
MRRMVLLLRSGGPESEHAVYVPAPGLADIPELVRKTSETAQLSTFGPTPRVSQALGLSAYRIVQESLTNVLKHAGPDAVARGQRRLHSGIDRAGDHRRRARRGRLDRQSRPRPAGDAGAGRLARRDLDHRAAVPRLRVRASLPYGHEPGFRQMLINSDRRA